MAFKLKSFKELVSMTKEQLDETLVPLRVRAARAKADGELVKLEEQLLDLEAKINKGCAEKDINFGAVCDLMNQYDLTERRLKQIKELVAALFPAEG